MLAHPPHGGYVISGGGALGKYTSVVVPWHIKGGGGVLRCGHNPKTMGVLGTYTVRKSGVLGTCLVKREGLRNWSCTKGGSWELIYHLSLRLLVNMTYRLIKKGLRNGHNQKGKVLGAGPTQRGGQIKGGGVSTAAHTCTGYICEPPHNVGSWTTENNGTWTLLSD